MENRNRNAMIVSIVALVLVLIGVTYAYFSARITGLESASTISLTAGRMGIVYSEGDENVSVSGIYPREQEWLTKTITLTGYNTTDQEMPYDLGLQVTSNTFKGGQLTLSLTGVGSNGTKIADITSKSITKTSGFFKIGTGTFLQADGATHVYTIKIYFKDNGKDQNFNQEAVFNAKFTVREQGAQVTKANQNHNGKHCYTNDYVANVAIATGTEYINGQYKYRYNQNSGNSDIGWQTDESQNGWGAALTNHYSEDPITTEFCAFVNEIPVVNIDSLFYDILAPTIDLSSFDTSNVTSMIGTFAYMRETASIDVSTFDTSNVTDMSYMFWTNEATTITGLTSFDTSNVTNMYEMFSECDTESLDLSSFDTSNVISMESMFHLSRATSLDLSSFDTSHVTNMASMFNNSKATSIDLSSFDTSNVTTMAGMFANSEAISIDVSSFDTSNVTSMSDMFRNTKDTSLDLSSFDTSKVTDMSNMFTNALATSITGLISFDTSNVTTMQGMFWNSGVLSLDLSSFNTSNVTNMSYMFSGSAVTTLDLSSFDTSNVIGMASMFSNCAATTGYARTQSDADRFNNVTGSLSNGNSPYTSIPNTLHFVVK